MEKPDNKEPVTIEINSVLFNTTESTLKAIDGTLLSKLDKSSEYFNKHQNVFSFDRDPYLFRHILNIHRNKEVHIPRNVCPVFFRKELQFWDIPLKLIAPCCWKYLYETEEHIEDMQKIIGEDDEFNAQMKARNQITPVRHSFIPKMEDMIKENGWISRKNKAPPSKLWLFLEEPASSMAATVWCYFYICVVLVSVILYVIWLTPSVRVNRYLCTSENTRDIFNFNDTMYQYLVKKYNEKLLMAGGTDPHPTLLAVDIFCLIFFIFEILLSICVCPDLKKYITNGYSLMKIFVCSFMTISFVMEFDKDRVIDNVNLGRFMIACRCFSVLRLALILRFRKIYGALHIMLLALRHSVKELFLLLFTFLIAVVVYGCLIFSAEIENEMFPSTLISMWWALITMTTIGYGDYFPVSIFGYVVGVICAINGIIVLALPIAAIAGAFGSLFARNAEFQKHKLAIKEQEETTFRKK